MTASAMHTPGQTRQEYFSPPPEYIKHKDRLQYLAVETLWIVYPNLDCEDENCSISNHIEVVVGEIEQSHVWKAMVCFESLSKMDCERVLRMMRCTLRSAIARRWAAPLV